MRLGADWSGLLRRAREPADLLLGPPAGGAPGPGAVVVHPGAASPSGDGPAERFAEVAPAPRGRGENQVRADRLRPEADWPRSPPAGRAAGRLPCSRAHLDLGELAAVVWAAARWWSPATPAWPTSRPHTPRPRCCCSARVARAVGPPAAGTAHRSCGTAGTRRPARRGARPGVARIAVDEVVAAARWRLRAGPARRGYASPQR